MSNKWEVKFNQNNHNRVDIYFNDSLWLQELKYSVAGNIIGARIMPDDNYIQLGKSRRVVDFMIDHIGANHNRRVRLDEMLAAFKADSDG